MRGNSDLICHEPNVNTLNFTLQNKHTKREREKKEKERKKKTEIKIDKYKQRYRVKKT